MVKYRFNFAIKILCNKRFCNNAWHCAGVCVRVFQDYPSVGHLSQVLQANNIQLIFAVTENSFPAYQVRAAP